MMPDGTILYSAEEFQDLLEMKLKQEKTIPLVDMILSLLHAKDGKPIYGRTMMMKQVFLLYEELLPKFEIVAQDPRFVPYRYGPYSFQVMNLLDNLWFSGYINADGKRNTRKERFSLTVAGRNRAARRRESFPDEFNQTLSDSRIGWDQLGTEGILRYVYSNYERYIDKSEIKERYKDIVWGKGKA